MTRNALFARFCWSAVFAVVIASNPQGSAEESITPSVEVQGTLLAPKAFRAAAARARPSIVTIETIGGVLGETKRGGGASFRPGEGPTTGVVITSDGYIITSTFNFVTRPPIITVIFADGQRRVATLLGRDNTRKLCLLKVDGVSDLQAAKSALLENIHVGDWAVALGMGFGESEPGVSAGIISATNRVSGRAVQTDANLSPANYGGPLVDIEGNVIGVCVPLSPTSKEVAAGAEWYDSGIGFAVPLAAVERILPELKVGKTLEHGYLGIQGAPYGELPTGVEVKKVLPDSAAAKAEVKEGDRILKFANNDVLDSVHLASLVGRYLLGDVVKVEVQRGDERLTLDVTLASLPAVPMPMNDADAEIKKPGEQPAPPGERPLPN